MKKLKQKNNGITLIALIVTIIVLLILAGITIATLTGENGIITRAIDARDQTVVGREKEEIALAWNGAVLDKLGGTDITATDLNEQFEKNNTNATASGSINVEFTDSHHWYKIDSDGNITGPFASEDEIVSNMTLVEMFKKAQEDGCEGGESCTNPEEHLHIGDYVDYNPIATGDTGSEEKYKYESLSSKNGYTDLEKQVYTVNNDTEKVNWIVLGLSEDGNSLLITTGSPVRKEGTNNPEEDDPYFYMRGSAGYINAENELNKISEIYGNGEYATGARSITIEDINKLTGYDPETDFTDAEGALNEYGNKMTIKGNGDGTYSWSGATNGYEDGTFSEDHSDEGFYYIENNELKNIGTTDTNTEIELESGMYGYGAYDYVDEGSRVYNKFFNTEDKFYWLDSRAVHVSSYNAYFNLRFVNDGYVNGGELFFSDGYEYGRYYGVRPVVSLQSGVTEEEIAILGEQTEPIWYDRNAN